MARNVILRVREGDPACDRAREFVTRIAAERGLELDVRSLGPSPSDLLPQVSLWDGTWLDRVADEATLRDSITAKIRAEDAAAEADGSKQDAQLAREEAERSPERERFAKAPHPRRPVLLRGGRRRRWDLAARVARKVRSRAAPVVFLAVFVVAAAVLGGRESSEGDQAPRRDRPGVEAPRLDLPTLDGFRFDLGRERGRAVLVILFDARKPDRNGLAALAAEAQKVADRSRGDARVVAVGVGLGLAELRAALRDVPFALTVAADADGRATGTFAASAGQGAWWLVDRTGRVVGRGGRPGPEAFSALLAAAGGAGSANRGP
jgi:hypothetical protein